MTFEEINIRPGKPRYKLQNKISWLVANTQEEVVITTALLMGAVFRRADRHSYDAGEGWFIAEYNGRPLEFTERFALHRSAVAFLICVRYFYGDEE